MRTLAAIHLVVLAQAAVQQAQSQGGDLKLLLFGIVAIAAAILLFALEIFVPSGMVLGTLSIVSLVAGIVMFSMYSPQLGLITGIVTLLSLPFFFAVAVRIWPHTPIARLLTLQSSQGTYTRAASAVDAATGPDDMDQPTEAPKREPSLVGLTGRAATDLRPVGTCVIDGKRIDCLAVGGVIRSGSPVKVVEVDGMQVKVREEA